MMNLNNYPEISKTELNQALAYATNQVESCLKDYTTMFKWPNSANNFYPLMYNREWTNGFFTGEIWLAYEHSQDERFKKAANIQVDSFLERIEKGIKVDHHDLGFLYSPSCVAAYKLCDNENGKKAAILAADKLITRFQPVGGFIQAWGSMNEPGNYRLIIDCLLNLPLLYWASEVTGDQKYKDIATKHIHTCLSVIVRPDNSTYHTYFFDEVTGLASRGVSHQGNRGESAWARGQAWGIYGLALSYKYTKNPEYLATCKKVTQFFIDHLPENLIPYWDFDFTDGSSEPRDSSASAIAICGMLELAKYCNEEEANYYTSTASKCLKALVDGCSIRDPKQGNGQIKHGVYGKSTATNGCKSHGIDECNAWGDYFYFEALTRLSKDWELYW